MATEKKTRKRKTKVEPVEGIPQKERAGEVKLVDITSLLPNPWQPRSVEIPEEFEALRDSIEKHGLLVTPIGRQSNGEVELADGYRRWKAMLDLKERHKGSIFYERFSFMPVLVQALSDQDMADVAFESNTKRAEVNPLDLAWAYRKYLDSFEITQEQFAQRRGLTQGELANMLRLLNLTDHVKELIISRGIMYSHARELLRLIDHPEDMDRLADQVIDRGMTVRELVTSINGFLRSEYKPLSDQGYPRCVFDTKACEDCESRVIVPSHWDEAPYCKDAVCWGLKTKEAEDAEYKKLQAKTKKLGNSVSLDQLDYGTYCRWDEGKIDNPDECQSCDKFKVGVSKHVEGGQQLCIDPSCYKKKGCKLTKERNQREDEAYLKDKEKALASLDLAVPFSRELCKVIVGFIMDHDTTKELCREKGVKMGQDGQWAKAMQDEVEALNDNGYRLYLVSVLFAKARVDQRYGFRDSLEGLIAALKPKEKKAPKKAKLNPAVGDESQAQTVVETAPIHEKPVEQEEKPEIAGCAISEVPMDVVKSLDWHTYRQEDELVFATQFENDTRLDTNVGVLVLKAGEWLVSTERDFSIVTNEAFEASYTKVEGVADPSPVSPGETAGFEALPDPFETLGQDLGIDPEEGL